jgi:hypothetical protein
MPAVRGREAGGEARLPRITTMARFARKYGAHEDNEKYLDCFVASVSVA